MFIADCQIILPFLFSRCVSVKISRDHRDGHAHSLVDQLAMEGNTHGTEQKPGVLVGSGAGVDSNVATGNHLGRVPKYYLLEIEHL